MPEGRGVYAPAQLLGFGARLLVYTQEGEDGETGLGARLDAVVGRVVGRADFDDAGVVEGEIPNFEAELNGKGREDRKSFGWV